MSWRFVVVVSCLLSCVRSGTFKTTWKTTTSNEAITLPLTNPSPITVDWGDGTNSTDLPTYSHTYAEPSTQTITIYGVVNGWNFYDQNCLQLLSVDEWGDLELHNNAFRGCSNLTFVAAGQPTIKGLEYVFMGCIRLNAPITWNISGVTSISGMFLDTPSFNQPITFVGVDSLRFMSLVFVRSGFNQLFRPNTTLVETMESMFAFSKFNQPVDFITTNLKNVTRMFEGNLEFNSTVNFSSTDGIINMESMFDGANKFNQNLAGWSVKNVMYCENFCQRCGMPRFESCIPKCSTVVTPDGWTMCTDKFDFGVRVSAPYSDSINTVIQAPLNVTVIVAPDPAYHGTGIITVEILPRNATSSVIARVIFIGPNGPQEITNLTNELTIQLPVEVALNDADVCLGKTHTRMAILPECQSYSPLLNQYLIGGCRRTNVSTTAIECKCNSPADVSAIMPHYNLVPLSAAFDVGAELPRHPIGLLATVGVAVAFLVVLCYACYKERQNVECDGLAEGSIFKEVQGAGCWAKWQRQFCFDLKRKFKRGGGPPTLYDRAFIFLFKVLTGMLVTASFHGEQNKFARAIIQLISGVVIWFPAKILEKLFTHIGPLQPYQKLEIDARIRKDRRERLCGPCLHRCETNVRFGVFCWVVIFVVGCIEASQIVLLSVQFDSVPENYCNGFTAEEWLQDWAISYAYSVAGDVLWLCFGAWWKAYNVRKYCCPKV